ncbi:MAG: hypothetical protein QOG46_2953, partial [Pseudonocardiales bacterium]|nr:hypothetical protein [Pseudonocardiales bacterium]
PDGACFGDTCVADSPGVHTVTGTKNGVTATTTFDAQPPIDQFGTNPTTTTLEPPGFMAAGVPATFTAQTTPRPPQDFGCSYPNNHLFWYVDGSPIDPIASETGGCTVRIATPGRHAVSVVFAGANSAFGFPAYGRSAATRYVTVYGPTAGIALDPASQSGKAGEAATYHVNEVDSAGTGLRPADSAIVSMVPDGSCTLPHDRGTVECTPARKGVNTVTATQGSYTTTATLNAGVGGVRTLRLTPATATTVSGGQVGFSAEGLDLAGDSVGNLTNSSNFSISSGGSCSGATCGADRAGTYTVTATSGQATGTATLTITATPPGEPPQPSATRGNGQATVDFVAPTRDGGSDITGYTVTAHDQSNPSSPTNGKTVSGGGSPLTVGGLTNGDSYTFTVKAINAAGTGDPSQPSAPVTPATVPSAPTGVSAVTGIDRGVVTFSPPTSTGGMPITGYTVTTRDTTNPSDPTNGKTVSGTASPLTITGLTAGHNYTFTVFAQNAIGPGPASSATGPGRVGCQTAATGSSVSFAEIGLEQCFTVPSGMTALRMRAIGAPGSAGGNGALASGAVSVSAGQTIFVEVGGKGSRTAGGFNGGGNGGWGELSSGRGGGGASDVRTCSITATSCTDGNLNTLGSRLLVAGGGGGGGGDVPSNFAGVWTAPGGAGGAAGGTSNVQDHGCGGGAGGVAAGGDGGCQDSFFFSVRGIAGALGVGGAGGSADGRGFGGGSGGGGGGGGYYGGGGGGGGFVGGGGGGGGSSHVPAGGTVAADSSGVPSIVIETADAPGAPSGASAVRGPGKATVSFPAPSSDGGSPVTGYVVTAHDKTNPGDATDGKTVSGSGSPVA